MANKSVIVWLVGTIRNFIKFDGFQNLIVQLIFIKLFFMPNFIYFNLEQSFCKK